MRRTIIFISLLILTLFNGVKGQKIPVYRDVNVCGQEGMTDSSIFRMLGERKYLSIIMNFENEFKKTENNYPDYYRFYRIYGDKSPLGLFVFLIPKKSVSEENKKKKEFRVYGSDLTLETFYDLKTKKIKKIYSRKINPDI
ncbi:hypothetical protein M2T78_07550 [Elizabethkingia ursingii]|uniref:hypothetical protein n=1 Tax=Elizabethkingia ursingii TaxID=1756150 RepID=UPI002012CA8E|nr:hypothetical protein [Elizabethkingia ursingii]MCL1664103.1 hypothetical protein [Elizabethkingia ursingii]